MIHPQHRQELLDSAIDEEVISLNFRFLEGLAAYYYLLYSDKLQRTNTGVLSRGILKKYAFLEDGGWWCNGIDPLNDYKEMLWGTLKPRSPRFNFEKRKYIKYEHPPKEETRAIFLRISWKIGLRIANLAGKGEEYGQRILQAYSRIEGASEETGTGTEGIVSSRKVDTERYKNRDDLHPGTRRVASDVIWIGVAAIPGEFLREEDYCFWEWVYRTPTIPLTITEGAKKAGALLTAGFAAIALPGVNNGYRTPKNEFGEKTGRPYLIPDLKHFATIGRSVSFCFDHDTKTETVRMVNNAISTTARLFSQDGCDVRVIEWDTAEKGVDEFIVAYGAEAFEQVYQVAQTLESWQARSFTRLTYPASLTVNRRYLGNISIPDDAKLVALKAPKGTGKTQLLETAVSDALARGQWVLVVGHRVQLLEALCQRFGLPYVTEVKSSETGATLGYGLCVDSLHPGSQARFNAANWRDGVVIIDESEQVIWHALNSSTCQTERVPILKELKTLLGNVLQGNGKVFLADADLSDLSIDFVRSLAGVDVKPWVVVNKWQPGPDECWNVHNYTGTNPSGLVDALETHIADGGRPFVVCSAQKAKSKWGTRTLESHFSKLSPDKRILRIDSETIADPNHPAFGCVGNLNVILSNYDIVLASPTIETGVSLDLRGHFTSVWGILLGVQAETSCRQALARLREPVDRHIWVAPYGIGKVGNGYTSIKSVLASQHKLAKANIKLLQDSALDDIELNFQPESLTTWAKMAVRVNLGMVHYRQSITEGLTAEGHRIVEEGKTVSDSVKKAVTDVREENHQAEAEAIAASEDISQREFEKLTDQKAKTQAERNIERKHSLQMRYSVPVDADLVLKDDDGWYPQLRLHYFMSVGREYLKRSDGQRVRSQSEKGNGAVWQPDLNKGQMSASVTVMQNLGVLELLTPGHEFRGSDATLQQMASVVKANSGDVLTALNLSISEKDTPIAIAQKLLSKLGLKLDCLRREGPRGDRQRVYGFTAPSDGREQVFTAWSARDTEALAADVAALSTATVSIPNSVSTPGNKDISMSPPDTEPHLPQTTGLLKAAEILTRCGQWLQGYFYIGQKGDYHQLADGTGYRGIFVGGNEFRFVDEAA